MKNPVRFALSALALVSAFAIASAQQPSEPIKQQPSVESLQQQIDLLQQQVNALRQQQSTRQSPAVAPANSHSDAPEPSLASPLVASLPQPETAPAAAPTPEDPKHSTPFAFADFTWLNGNARTKDTRLSIPSSLRRKFAPTSNYTYDFNHPQDDTIGGSSEVFRASEVQLTQLGVGGDFHYDNVRARLMTQFGLYSQTTPRNDASPARGQWNLADAYRYLSEAYGGYHFNVQHGINVDAGIFMSYVGLFSYYHFDNWAYQPSMSPRIRPGSSTACACSCSPRRS